MPAAEPPSAADGILGDRLVRLITTTLPLALASRIRQLRSGWCVLARVCFYNQDTGNPRFDMARNLAGRIRVNSQLHTPTLFCVLVQREMESGRSPLVSIARRRLA